MEAGLTHIVAQCRAHGGLTPGDTTHYQPSADNSFWLSTMVLSMVCQRITRIETHFDSPHHENVDLVGSLELGVSVWVSVIVSGSLRRPDMFSEMIV